MSADWPIADVALRVQIVTEAEMYGLAPTSRAWEIHRATIRKWGRELRESPLTCDLLQKRKAAERLAIKERQKHAHASVTQVLLAKLRAPDNELADLTAAYVATAKVAGLHRGDNRAAKKTSTGPGAPNVSIHLPQILTSPRLEAPDNELPQK